MRIILGISFIFLTTSSSIIHACPNSNCGDLFITYPFKLRSSQTAEDGCSYVDLRCNDDYSTAMNLPNGGGDLYVRNISYEYPYIQLYDPGNCLIERLISLNISLSVSLASSPLEAFAGAKYALYTCPAAAVDTSRDGLYRIDCLSNTTNVTVAVDFPPLLALEGVGCQEIGNYVLPFPSDGFNDDLFLTWDSASCPACANTDDNNPWDGFSGSPYFSSIFVVIAVVVTTASFLITRKIVGRLSPNAAADGLPVAAAPPLAVFGGLEESKIESYTKLMALSESIVDCGSDSHGCPICLESFEAQELVRSIVPCHHCFHAHCILTWLIKSRTCPVCRLILSET